MRNLSVQWEMESKLSRGVHEDQQRNTAVVFRQINELMGESRAPLSEDMVYASVRLLFGSAIRAARKQLPTLVLDQNEWTTLAFGERHIDPTGQGDRPTANQKTWYERQTGVFDPELQIATLGRIATGILNSEILDQQQELACGGALAALQVADL